MAVEIGLGLVATGVGLGLRHGIDWDHIAAITDVTSSQPNRRRSLIMGTLYALGHASVVITLGLIAIVAAAQLPESLDKYMETVVGVTLLTLGVWVFWSLLRHPDHFMLRSRWMLVFAGVRRGYRWAMHHFTGKEYAQDTQPSKAYGGAASTGIGMIHGIGAETGSQALILAGAAGATSATAGSFMLIFFVIGLVISNTMITLASTAGILGAQTHRYIYIGLGVLIGSFSLIIGALFVSQQASLLPGFFG